MYPAMVSADIDNAYGHAERINARHEIAYHVTIARDVLCRLSRS
jgi:hypothetical protein